MDRNGIVGAVVVLLLILSHVSKASFPWKLRQLAAVAPTHVTSSSPSPTPDPSQIVGDGGSGSNTGNTSQDVSKVVDSDSKGLSNNNNDSTTNKTEKAGPSPSQIHNDKGDTHTDQLTTKEDKLKDNKKKDRDNTTGAEEAKMPTEPGPAENCTGAAQVCNFQDSFWVACLLNYYPGSQEFVILVQNVGERTLKVDLTAPNPGDSAPYEIPKHKNRKMNLTAGNGTKVILRTETGKCELPTNPSMSLGSSFLRFPSTDKLITPVNGAYFLIFTVIVFGGSCACFMFRRRRRQGGGIPYQELEMAFPESSSTNLVDSAEGWDQDWDDDWDEENAMKSPAAHHAGSISANGLTSRSLNKDSWENGWDD